MKVSTDIPSVGRFITAWEEIMRWNREMIGRGLIAVLAVCGVFTAATFTAPLLGSALVIANAPVIGAETARVLKIIAPTQGVFIPGQPVVVRTGTVTFGGEVVRTYATEFDRAKLELAGKLLEREAQKISDRLPATSEPATDIRPPMCSFAAPGCDEIFQRM